MISRRRFVSGIGAALLAPVVAQAQQPGKVWRIGFLSATSATVPPGFVEAFLQGLRELGYVEGQGIDVEYRFAGGNFELLAALAAELVHRKVDVIVAVGVPPTRAAKEVTTTTPIVMSAAGDPVRTGLVASLARPGGNVTGVSDVTVDLSAKRLALLKEVVPAASRVGIVWNPANPTNLLQLQDSQLAARSLGVTVQSVEVREPQAFDRAFAAMVEQRANAHVVLADPFLTVHRSRLAQIAAQQRLPAMCALREHVEVGCLMSYGPSFLDLQRRAAWFVDKILKGAKPADLPIEQPTKFELVINMKTAKALGLTVPPSLLLRAIR